MMLSFLQHRFVWTSRWRLKFGGTLSSHEFSDYKHNYLRKLLYMESNEPEWVKISKDHHLLSSIGSNLLSESRFQDLDHLVDKIGLSKCSLGLQTTLLKSYLERKEWQKAQNLHSGIEPNLRHLRINHSMIQAFSNNNQLSLAQVYLQSLIDKENNQKVNKNISTSKKTLESFLEATINHGEGSFTRKALSTALQYMKYGNIAPNISISNQLIKLFSIVNCEIESVRLSETSLCSYCRRSLLEIDIDNNSIFSLLRSKIEQKLIENGAHSFLEEIKSGKKNYYNYNKSIVLDVANILYGHSGQHHKPNFLKFKSVMSNIIDKNKQNRLNILLVLPRGGTNQKLNLLKHMRNLQQENVMTCNIDIISNQKIEDDLLVLYLAATNQSETSIVSNDFYQKHLNLVPEINRRDLSTWLQSVIKTFDNGGNIDFSPHIPVIVKHGTERMHILTEEKKVFCLNPCNLYHPNFIP